MSAGNDTATEITRDIIVAMIGDGAMGVSPDAAKRVADAFEIVHTMVESKWRNE